MLSAVSLLGLVGCKPEEEITREEVTYPDREKLRLRVAIMKHGPLVWFFRFSGPLAQVEEHGKTFDDLVNSVRFDKDEIPSWTDPKGWKKDLPTPECYAGYRIDVKPKNLEIAVTQFPAEKFDLMQNM